MSFYRFINCTLYEAMKLNSTDWFYQVSLRSLERDEFIMKCSYNNVGQWISVGHVQKSEEIVEIFRFFLF